MKSPEISILLDNLEQVVGTAWLHDQVEKIRDRDPRQMLGASPGDTGIHPLGAAWFKAREELILSEITGSRIFSASTLLVTRLGMEIPMVREMNGFEQQKKRLLDQNLYPKASYETSIAAGYTQTGARVEFCEHDLKIIVPGGSVTAVCRAETFKAAEDYTRLERDIENIKSCEGATLLYVELAPGSNQQVYDYTRTNRKKFASLLAGHSLNALVLTCREVITGEGGRLSLRDTGYKIETPSPRFQLPSGFCFYIPGEDLFASCS